MSFTRLYEHSEKNVLGDATAMTFTGCSARCGSLLYVQG